MCIEYHSLIFLLFFRTENTDACLNNAKTKLKGLLWSETCSWISAEHAPSVKVAVSKQVKLHFWKQNGDASLEQPECMKWGVQDWISYPLMYERFKESQWFFLFVWFVFLSILFLLWLEPQAGTSGQVGTAIACLVLCRKVSAVRAAWEQHAAVLARHTACAFRWQLFSSHLLIFIDIDFYTDIFLFY